MLESRPSAGHMPASFGYSRPGNNSMLVKPPADWRDLLLAPGAFDWLAALLDGCRASPESALAFAARHLLVCPAQQHFLSRTHSTGQGATFAGSLDCLWLRAVLKPGGHGAAAAVGVSSSLLTKLPTRELSRWHAAGAALLGVWGRFPRKRTRSSAARWACEPVPARRMHTCSGCWARSCPGSGPRTPPCTARPRAARQSCWTPAGKTKHAEACSPPPKPQALTLGSLACCEGSH